MIFLSSNEVFDGLHLKVKANATKRPRSEYGRQKSEIENRIQEHINNYYIIRLTKVIFSNDRIFQTWCSKLKRSEIIEPFHDLLLSPISLSAVEEMITKVIISEKSHSRILQLSANKDFSYADAAYHLADILKVNPNLVRPKSGKGIVESKRLLRFTSLENSFSNTHFGSSGLEALNIFAKNSFN